MVVPENVAIHRMHGGNRLSGNARMAEGIFQFTRKYRSLMNTETLLYNKKKIHQYHHLAGKPLSFLLYLGYALLLKIAKLCNRR